MHIRYEKSKVMTDEHKSNVFVFLFQFQSGDSYPDRIERLRKQYLEEEGEKKQKEGGEASFDNLVESMEGFAEGAVDPPRYMG